VSSGNNLTEGVDMRLTRIIFTILGSALISGTVAIGTAVAEPGNCPDGLTACREELTQQQIFMCAPYWLHKTPYNHDTPQYCLRHQ